MGSHGSMDLSQCSALFSQATSPWISPSALHNSPQPPLHGSLPVLCTILPSNLSMDLSQCCALFSPATSPWISPSAMHYSPQPPLHGSLPVLCTILPSPSLS